jgi:hypothetical protein
LKQGDIRQLMALSSKVPQYAVVLSGPIHLSAATGRVITCRIIPGAARDDFVGVQQVSYTGADGVTTLGLAVPELVEWHPASGLGPAVGTVGNAHGMLRLVRSLFD